MNINTENSTIQLSKPKREFLHLMEEHPELLDPMLAMLEEYIAAREDIGIAKDDPATELLDIFLDKYEPYMLEALREAEKSNT